MGDIPVNSQAWYSPKQLQNEQANNTPLIQTRSAPSKHLPHTVCVEDALCFIWNQHVTSLGLSLEPSTKCKLLQAIESLCTKVLLTLYFHYC